MNIKIVTLDPKKLIGISWSGPYSQMQNIPKLFQEFEARLEEIQQKTEETAFICPFHDRKTDFTYYVTIEVESFDPIPPDMVGIELPEQKYIKGIHEGPENEVQNTYYKLFDWMKQNGYSKDYRSLSIEIYHEDDEEINKSSENRKFEIYIPVNE